MAMTMDALSFARWLKARLTERRMSQAELADKLGVAQNTVSRWLNDRRQPKPELMEQMALVLGVPVDEVLVAAGMLSEERAKVGPRARLLDLIALLPDEEVTNILAFAEFREAQYRQAMRVARSRNSSAGGVSGGTETTSEMPVP